MSSLPHHSMFEYDNILVMNRLVKSTMTLLEMDEQATLIASPFGPFYSVVLLFWVTGVALLADLEGQPSYLHIWISIDQK
jgi:hypothetical protein